VADLDQRAGAAVADDRARDVGGRRQAVLRDGGLLAADEVLGNSGKHITLETSQSNGILKVCFSGAGNSRIQEVRDLRSLEFANVQSSGILIR
jgi:hypothetical protein